MEDKRRGTSPSESTYESGSDATTQSSLLVREQRGADEQHLGARLEAGDERGVDHLPVEEGLFAQHGREIAPARGSAVERGVAAGFLDPDLLRASVYANCDRSELGLGPQINASMSSEGTFLYDNLGRGGKENPV